MVSHNIPYEEIIMDPDQDDYLAQREVLFSQSGGHHKTFPFIFAGSNFIGGYTDLVRSYETNTLHTLITGLEYSF